MQPVTYGVPRVAASFVPTVDRARMAEINRLAIEEFGITLCQMMEQAGSHVAETARVELSGDLTGRAIVVAAGPGNNGGAGLAAARHLVNRGASVRVVLSRPALRLAAAGRHQLAALLTMGAECCVATYDLTDEDLDGVLIRADLVVDALLGPRDALLGSGDALAGVLTGEVERLVSAITRASRPVLSLDIPTGVDPESGVAEGPALTPAATLSLALPWGGLVRAATAGRIGRLYLADIGLPATLYARVGIDVPNLFSAARIIELDTAR
jgi:NAD(P)H-hydrate epimerase